MSCVLQGCISSVRSSAFIENSFRLTITDCVLQCCISPACKLPHFQYHYPDVQICLQTHNSWLKITYPLVAKYNSKLKYVIIITSAKYFWRREPDMRIHSGSPWSSWVWSWDHYYIPTKLNNYVMRKQKYSFNRICCYATSTHCFLDTYYSMLTNYHPIGLSHNTVNYA